MYKKTEKLRVGDPLSDDTDVGPLVNHSGLEAIEGMVKRAINQGAELLAGGERLKSRGYYFSPTVLWKNSSWYGNRSGGILRACRPILIAEDEKAELKLQMIPNLVSGEYWTQNLDKAERLLGW